jgi:hypothetical protein
LEELSECVYQGLKPLREYQIRLPYNSQSLRELSRLYETAELLQVSYEDELVIRLKGRAEAVYRALQSGEHKSLNHDE